ncbi:MAG: prepilin-type N-terminal cleavage/methylation domain-containing protein [Bacillota bacterium]|nr:prepilin-type N-terminal cleavage/methylation domain-containing protein [Bacillota bacterium]
MKNNKGFTLLELLIVIAIIGIITPIICSMFESNIDINTTYTNYLYQQDKVTQTLQLLRKDIEEASGYNLDTLTQTLRLDFIDSTSKYWRLNSDSTSTDYNSLEFSSDGSKYEVVIQGIDTTNSSFIKNDSEKIITLKIKPVKTNSIKKDQSRNISEPIVTDFSVRYKKN